MKAVRCRRDRVIHSDSPEPEREATDAVLRVAPMEYASRTTTSAMADDPRWDNETPVPIVLGHEYCGVCEQCQGGHENVCLDGGRTTKSCA